MSTALRQLCAVVCGLVALVGAAGPARAQGDPENEFDPINYAFAAYLGSGIYSSSGRTVYIFRIPATVTVRKQDEEKFGIKARISTTLGFYDFEPADIPGSGLPDSIGTVSILPGVLFDIPIYDNWRFSPFADFGVARDNETDQKAYVFGTGVRSRAQFPWKIRTTVLWNELLYARNISNDETPNNDFLRFQTKYEVRHPVGQVQGHDTSVGPYIQNELYFGDLLVNQPGGGEIDLRTRWEVGLTYGTTERSRLWIFTLPRIGLGYRFGQDVSSLVVKFSFSY